MPAVEINWWAVLVAAAANSAIGALWYSPLLFGKPWARLHGRRFEELPRSRNLRTIAPLSAALTVLIAFILVHFIRYDGAITAVRGVAAGFWLWLGFIAAVTAAASLFEGRSWKLWTIDAGYWLTVFLVNGALLAAWR